MPSAVDCDLDGVRTELDVVQAPGHPVSGGRRRGTGDEVDRLRIESAGGLSCFQGAEGRTAALRPLDGVVPGPQHDRWD